MIRASLGPTFLYCLDDEKGEQGQYGQDDAGDDQDAGKSHEGLLGGRSVIGGSADLGYWKSNYYCPGGSSQADRDSGKSGPGSPLGATVRCALIDFHREPSIQPLSTAHWSSRR